MAVSFKSKSAAIKAARKSLGADAQNSIDFTILQDGETYSWEPKTSGKTLAELIETAEVVDGLPNVALILATEGGDLGPVNAENARAVALEEANNLGVAVSIRNELTDEVIEVVEPTPSPEGEEEGEVFDARPASEVLGKIEESVEVIETAPGEFSTTIGMEDAVPRDFKAEIDEVYAIYKAAIERAKAERTKALADIYEAQKAAKPSRVVKSAETRARSTKVDGPSGKTAEVIELAKRPEGVTVAELIALTGWTKAPWSWNFTNPKGNGWAQKFGYKFRSEKGEDRKVRYFLTAE